MKKIILTSSLILIILASLLSGTLAIYSKTVGIDTPGSVIAKDFIFLIDGTETFQHNVKIAPTETVVFQFGVRNYDGAAVSDTAMRYDLAIDVGAAPGKTAIGPMIVRVKNEAGHIIDSLTFTGTLNLSSLFPISSEGQRHGYIIEFYWPSTDNDIDFEGDNYSTQLNVSATAVQMTEDVYLLPGNLVRMGVGGHQAFAYEYLGNYRNIVIPPAVGDIPVDSIYQDSFANKDLAFVAFTPDCAITRIHARAFKNNDLQEIALPYSLQYIDYGAFMENDNLTKITIGANVELQSAVFLNNDKFRQAYNDIYGKSAGTYVYTDGNWVKQ